MVAGIQSYDHACWVAWSLDNKLVNYSEVSEQNFRANDHTNFHSTMRCLDSSIPYRSVKIQRTNVNMYMNSLSAF
jgi:hypothetical protein